MGNFQPLGSPGENTLTEPSYIEVYSRGKIVLNNKEIDGLCFIEHKYFYVQPYCNYFL
jgi:hypothetical protein